MVDSAIVEWDNSLEGDAAMYSCLHGYRFSDGSNRRVVVCLSGGQWSYVPKGCQRECDVALNVCTLFHNDIKWINGSMISKQTKHALKKKGNTVKHLL